MKFRRVVRIVLAAAVWVGLVALLLLGMAEALPVLMRALIAPIPYPYPY